MPHFEDLTLYYKKTCPYCIKVLNFMDANDIELDLRETLMPKNKDDLLRIGGKNQVPCLIIKGEPLYESDDIIEYLRGCLD